ncbi:UvrABC system protein A [Planctomycetales bacterium 10988]|nr:UvrABC system protein A [Planctomycetales bacterium 10988]
MDASEIIIRGAREHNLQNVDVTLPRNQLICLTGVSGSGKSSLAFDTLYAEGQRRYIESLSSFARQFLGQMPKPDADYLSGLSPSISISQKTSGQNPRSTVGTITEIYDFLRVLYARVGEGHCPRCQAPLTGQSREQIIDRILSLPEKTKIQILAPVIRAQKGEYRDLFEDLLKQGFLRARVDGKVVRLTENLGLDRQMRHDIEIVIDRLTVSKESRSRLAEAVGQGLKHGDGDLYVLTDLQTPQDDQPQELRLSSRYCCIPCDVSYEPPSPQLFSFNSPQGMCPACQGIGIRTTIDPDLLVTNPELSFQQGCIDLIGPWKELGRWRRHIFEGVAETLEYQQDAKSGTILKTPWKELNPYFQNSILFGTGDLHITFSWRAKRKIEKYGGKYEGIIPDLLSRYGNSTSRLYRKKMERFMNIQPCNYCEGDRLNLQARNVRLTTSHPDFKDQPQRSLPEVCKLSIEEAADFFQDLTLSDTQQTIATELLKEIRGRLGFLLNVGLNYLSLNRSAPTLSGGESQRIRLAGQVGCGLVGVTYILDEPSIGLHPRDNDRLIETLHQLRDLGNTVVVVEHDEDTMRESDYLIDFGPGPGHRGGRIVGEGSYHDLLKSKESLTGDYLSGRKEIVIPESRRLPTEKKLKVVGATHHNLKNVTAEIPLGLFVCVTGVSGSGKSSLIVDILSKALRRDLNGAESVPGKHQSIEGIEHLDKLIAIDQSPIGRTPRSNPATYIKVFDEIRKLYAKLPLSKSRGYQPGRFSFNVAGGRCEACEGNGSNRLEMDFLADVWVTCPVCKGQRFNHETLQIKYRDKSIAEVLDLEVHEALEHFSEITPVADKLKTLKDVGLDYLKLGQPSPTLSGGEAQRIKLARELVKRSTGQTVYLLDEPTTGLHFADIHQLLKVLTDFVEAGNTVLVIEHNLDVIKTADWILDLGPEGGKDGGQIISQGTPEEIAQHKDSHTGQALAKLFKRQASTSKSSRNGKKKTSTKRKTNGKSLQTIQLRGAAQHNLKQVDVDIPRDKMSVCCGLSGSGKSSLAMDTIYAEGQRRYIESLSAYARQFVSQMQKPKLEQISGLSPAIAIEQKNLAHTPRSTVGTVTEIYDYLRVLFARVGTPYCPSCEIPIGTQTTDEIIDQILQFPAGSRLYIMAPLQVSVGEKYEQLWDEMRESGYHRVRIDSKTYTLDKLPKIDRRRKHTVEVVLDRITVRQQSRSRLADSVETALALGQGVLHVAIVEEETPEKKWKTVVLSQHLACLSCGRSFEALSPHHFSFNSSLGWCPDCEGLGTQTGANPTALLKDGKLTLAEGAVALWPDVSAGLFQQMLSALEEQTGVPTDVPFDQLSSKDRRTVLHGAGETWIEVFPAGKKKSKRPLFRFQYKGLYPAIAEACRLSASLRGKFDAIVDQVECSTCGGSRLRDDAAAYHLHLAEKEAEISDAGGLTIDDVCRLPLNELLTYFETRKLDTSQAKIAEEILREICNRLRFLVEVGLEYLTLHRTAPTLSGGEAQRIRLASQIGSGLTGVLYVLDEPTVGLHPRDNRRLIRALERLRDLGNTLLLVEHDREVLEAADRLLDFGPGAGEFGGNIVASGTPKQVARRKSSVTGPFLSGKKSIAIPANRRIDARCDVEELAVGCDIASAEKFDAQEVGPVEQQWLTVCQARHHNLKSIDVSIPLGTLTVVAGLSGSGKSTLIEDILYKAMARRLHRARLIPGSHARIEGIEHINKVIRVDQQPLGNSPTSTPATYTGVFDLIRDLFAQIPLAKIRGYSARQFSFNVPGGRCEECQGSGQRLIEMHFLPDVWVECESCKGRRYQAETLEVQFRGKSIADVLELSCGKAKELFENVPKIHRVLKLLCDVGLEYLRLGQPAPTLSGGEAQRVKLAAELGRPDTGRTLYLLDEPTTGLHFEDLAKLLDVFQRLVDLGNTVVVIEHNLDVMKCADWILELGPEAGQAGGQLVTCGTPEEVVSYAKAQKSTENNATTKKRKTKKAAPVPVLRSYTGEVLTEILAAGPYQERSVFVPEEEAVESLKTELESLGAEVQMPWEENGRKWHTEDRVSTKGKPCKWDGNFLGELVDQIQENGEFSETNWNHRSVVEIAAPVKSHGWFLHAHTSHPWILTLKFRVKRNTFKQATLQREFPLPTLDEMQDLPVYGSDARVTVRQQRGPMQEIMFKIHQGSELNSKSFSKFLAEAIESFSQLNDLRGQNVENWMPWKVMGEKWHLGSSGFPAGKTLDWEHPELLQSLADLLRSIAPDGQFDWKQQLLVHYSIPQQSQPWVTMITKKVEGLVVQLNGPSGAFAYGQLVQWLHEVELIEEKKEDFDAIRFTLKTADELNQPGLMTLLQEHFQVVAAAAIS